MNAELNDQLRKAQQGVSRLHKIDSILKNLELEVEELQKKENQLKKIADKEKYDVEKLEKMSLTAKFYSMLGTLEEHMEKERRESLSAQLKYTQVNRDLKDIEDQVSKLTTERINYVNCEEEYHNLYEKKRQSIIKGMGKAKEKLLELTDILNTAMINENEIKEAIAKGNEVTLSLNRALDSLSSAEGWGTWDLFGGGLLSDLAKHSNIDYAEAEIKNTQRLLRQFKTELVDIDISSDIMIDIDGFSKFADFFFDGFIADWFMQSKINQSQENVYHVRSQVLNIMEKLNQLLEEEESEIQNLKVEIDTLILQS